MQAIQTKRVSSTKGSTGFYAKCAAKSITVEYDFGLNNTRNHIAAAEQLVIELGWNDTGYGKLVSGTLADGSMVHVLSGRSGQGDEW